MPQFLHMLGIILCLVTIIGALGGSLRYQENFYEEVFDLVDSEEGFEEKEKEKEKEEKQNSEEIVGLDEAMITQAEVEEPSPESVKEAAPEPSPVPSPVEEENVEVEAYDQDEVYASI